LIELAPGMRLGSYELASIIGRTGMSEVWSGHDRDGTIVALKTISSQAGDDPQLRERFLREGGEHQMLNHPNIVPILDFFEQDGEFYLVMKYVSGGSLEDRLERNGWRAIPIPEALNISRQILPALDYAHQRLIVHRDVKPSNILLEGDHAYLGDFGIALALARPRITRFSQVIGTRCYMSPEQIQTPLEITHLTDVYSFGCVLYEMITGKQPYPSDGSEKAQYAMLAKRVHEPPVPPRQFNPQISLRLERIVLTALSAAPGDRFPGCGSFARALEGVENEKFVTPQPVPAPVPPGPVLPLVIPPIPPRPPVAAKAVRAMSVAGNVVVAVVAALIWLPFAGQPDENLLPVMGLAAMAANIVALRALYKAWDALPAHAARTSPGKASGYLFIPFYNLYWCWNVFPGFAADYNEFMKRSGLLQSPQPAGFYKFYCIMFYVQCLAGLMQLAALAVWIALFSLVILLPIMVGILAGAVNKLAAVASIQSAAVPGKEQLAR
jgi:hypothetical protein